MKRKIQISRIRRNCSYTVQDLCQLFGIHKNTVRNWFRKGLAKTDSQRPYLIHGNDLREFLGKLQKSRKKKCALDEFYCLRCRLPRRALGNMADLQIRSEKSLMLTAFCKACETTLYKLQSLKKLPKILQTFDIPRQQVTHLSESLSLSLNCHLTEESET